MKWQLVAQDRARRFMGTSLPDSCLLYVTSSSPPLPIIVPIRTPVPLLQASDGNTGLSLKGWGKVLSFSLFLVERYWVQIPGALSLWKPHVSLVVLPLHLCWEDHSVQRDLSRTPRALFSSVLFAAGVRIHTLLDQQEANKYKRG